LETLRGEGLTTEEMGQACRLAYQAVRAPTVGPSSSPEALRAELERIAPDNRVVLNRVRLFKIIRDVLDVGLTTVLGLLVEEVQAKDGERFQAVGLRRRDEIATGSKVPTLLASATARPEVLRAVWQALEEVINAEAGMPHVTVRQITVRGFGA
jgi:hypothetical protein